ncbi:MAG: hypothetical protein JJE55_06890 [Flavobacteriaceae bacterium]|nr:hypothetical protein [Flavobacteriaceae bacterium]
MKNFNFNKLFGFLFIIAAVLTFNAVSGNILGSSGDVAGPTTMMAAVAKTELIERELINKFRHDGTWLTVVPSKNQWVNNDVIKLNEIGADPTVLINNTSYPIAINARTDTSTPISLFKYDTENTKITDDELYALPYDKIGSVQRQHRETLEETTLWHALWNLAPDSDTATTPIVTTTGAGVSATPGDRLRLTYKDLLTMKSKLDTLLIPTVGRVLVLNSDHVIDLLLDDKGLTNQYQNHTNGLIAKNYAGFELYEHQNEVKYTGGAKIAFKAATAGSNASVVFHKKTTAKARGSVAAYSALSKDDPANRQTVLGMRLWFICVPTQTKGQGAIIDGVVPA